MGSTSIVRSIAALTGVLYLLTEPLGLEAQTDPTRVVFEHSACLENTAAVTEVTELLRIELLSDGVAEVHTGNILQNDESPSTVLSAEVDCANPDFVRLQVGDQRTAPASVHEMRLQNMPRANRPRAIALALSQLLHTSWSERPAPHSEEDERGGARPDNPGIDRATQGENRNRDERGEALARAIGHESPQPGGSVTPNVSHFRVGLVADFRFFVDQNTSIVGPHLSIRWRWVKAEIATLLGRASDPLGAARIGLVFSSLHFRVLQHSRPRWSLSASPFAEVGAAWAAGQTTRRDIGTRTATAPYFAVGVEISTMLHVRNRWSIGIGASTGWAKGLVVRADDRPFASTDGGFIGAQMSLFFKP